MKIKIVLPILPSIILIFFIFLSKAPLPACAQDPIPPGANLPPPVVCTNNTNQPPYAAGYESCGAGGFCVFPCNNFFGNGNIVSQDSNAECSFACASVPSCSSLYGSTYTDIPGQCGTDLGNPYRCCVNTAQSAPACSDVGGVCAPNIGINKGTCNGKPDTPIYDENYGGCLDGCCRPQLCSDTGGICIPINRRAPNGYVATGAECNTIVDEICYVQAPLCNNTIQCSNACQLPANSCSNSTQSCYYTQSQTCTDQPYTYTCSYNNCSAGYAPSGPTGAGCLCVTNITVHVYKDYNHDGTVNGNDAGIAGITISDGGGNTPQTDGTGTVTFTGKTTGTYTITMSSYPAGYQPVGATSQQVVLNNSNGNAVVNFYLTPLYQLSGTVFTDFDVSHCYDPSGKSCAYNGTTYGGDGQGTDSIYGTGHIVITGPVNTTANAGNGSLDGFGDNFQTTQTLTSGTYTVTYDTGTTPLASGYKFTTPSTYTVYLGDTADNQAGYTCSRGTSTDTINTTCQNPNNGSLVGVNFGVSNENSWIQSYCGDLRVDSGYSQPIPATANCNGTSGPYAIMNSASLCPANAGVLFSGGTDPTYGQGSGSSVNPALQVGNSLFPENFTTHTPGAIESAYNFVLDSTNNLATPPTPLGDDCADLTNCDIKSLPGGVYTTTAADGPVTLHASGDNTLTANYTFVIGGDLTIDSNIFEAAGYSAAFISGGDIHVDGSVGESNWNSINPDIEGLFSTDKNFDIDHVVGSTATCNSDGTPVDKKLNIDGTVITNAAGAGGSIVNNRDGCKQDLFCPTSVIITSPNQILHAPSILKIPLTLWQELNP